MSVNSSTLLIRVADLAYPRYFADLKAEHKDTMFPPILTAEEASALGYELVLNSLIPEGDVVTEGAPVLTAGKYYRTWNTRDFTPEEVASRLEQTRTETLNQIEALFLKDAEAGLQYELNGEVFHIQIRAKDKSNLIILRYMADIAIAANDTTPMEFRSFENLTHSMTPTEMSTMMGVAFFGGSALYAAAWALKDQAVAATTIAELPAVPATLYS